MKSVLIRLHIAIIALVLGCATTSFGADQIDLVAVKAIKGTTWTGKNGNNMPCFDFTMGNHRLRLEDVRVIKHVENGKANFSGTFTMTNRKRWAFDPHLFVVFNCTGGEINQLVIKRDGRSGGFLDVIDEFGSDITGAAVGYATGDAKLAIAAKKSEEQFAKKTKKVFNLGDSSAPMSTAILQIVGEYAYRSK